MSHPKRRWWKLTLRKNTPVRGTQHLKWVRVSKLYIKCLFEYQQYSKGRGSDKTGAWFVIMQSTGIVINLHHLYPLRMKELALNPSKHLEMNRFQRHHWWCPLIQFYFYYGTFINRKTTPALHLLWRWERASWGTGGFADIVLLQCTWCLRKLKVISRIVLALQHLLHLRLCEAILTDLKSLISTT